MNIEQLSLLPKLPAISYVLIRGTLKGFVCYESDLNPDWYYVASSEGVELVHANDLSILPDPLDSEPNFHGNTV